MRKLYILIVLSFTIFAGCSFIPVFKYLTFTNGDCETKIIIIDNQDNKHEFSIKPNWEYLWSEDEVGDFRFIYIITGNNLEGLFKITNRYNKGIIPFDIITKNELGKRLEYEKENEKILISYDVNIAVIDNIFNLKYNEDKFNVFLVDNSAEDFLFYKEKYFKVYNLSLLGNTKSKCQLIARNTER